MIVKSARFIAADMSLLEHNILLMVAVAVHRFVERRSSQLDHSKLWKTDTLFSPLISHQQKPVTNYQYVYCVYQAVTKRFRDSHDRSGKMLRKTVEPNGNDAFLSPRFETKCRKTCQKGNATNSLRMWQFIWFGFTECSDLYCIM